MTGYGEKLGLHGFRQTVGPQPGLPLEGVIWHSLLLERAGLDQDAVFTNLVAETRSLLPERAALAPQRQRPAAKNSTHMRDNTCEVNPVIDPSRRLVKESICKHKHIDQAIQAPFPVVQDRYTLSPECEAAIDLMCSMTGQDLAKWRAKQVDKLCKIAHKCKPLTAKWFATVGDVPQGVKVLRAGFNVAFIAVMLETVD